MKTVLQVAAKAVLINSKGEILILREPVKNNPGTKDGLYGFPGGRMEVEETFNKALKREVLEEAGLEIEPLYPIFIGEWSPIINNIKCHIVAIFTLCRAKNTDVQLSFEHDDFQWVAPEKIENYPLMDMEADVVRRLIEINSGRLAA